MVENRARPGKKSITKQSLIDKSFFMICSLMVALLLIRDVGNVSMSKWIFVALAVIVFLFFNMNYAAVFACFTIPFMVGLPGSYIFASGLIIVLVKYWKRMSINKNILILIMIFIVELLSFGYGDFSLVDYLRFIAPLLFISIIIFNNKDNLDCKKILYYFLFAAVCAQLSVILQSISFNGLDNLISSGVRLGNTEKLLTEEGMIISFNPNAFGRLSTFSIGVLLVFLRRDVGAKLILIALLVFEVLVGSMSMSRNYLVLLAVIVVMYVLTADKSVRKIFINLAQIFVITLAVYASINYYIPSLYESFSSRFAVEDISNGRIDITAAYFDVLTQHPGRLFLGVGLQNYSDKSGMPISCHNGIQEVLVTWGAAGLLLVGFYLYGIYKQGWRRVGKDKRKVIYLLPFIILLISVQSGQFFYGNAPLYLLPAYITMRLAQSNP